MEEQQPKTNADLKVLLIFFISLIVIIGAVYFGKIRPDNIRQECRDKAIREGAKESQTQVDQTNSLINLGNWTAQMAYRKCLNEKGITGE